MFYEMFRYALGDGLEIFQECLNIFCGYFKNTFRVFKIYVQKCFVDVFGNVLEMFIYFKRMFVDVLDGVAKKF